MKFLVKCAVLLMPALALAMPALGQDRDVRLSDSQEPGSVIIFPKFINRAAVRLDNATTGPVLPRTEIEIGVLCPRGVTCTEHQPVKIRFHWQCPGSQDPFFKYVCPETDFDLVVSVNGKIAFSADGLPINSNTPRIPKPPCANGYLIGWVVNQSDLPIKWDGLIGEAILRGPAIVDPPGLGALSGTSLAVSAYSGITIQGPIAPANGTLIDVAGNELHFSGDPRQYLGVTGVLFGDVKFDNLATDPVHTVPTPVNAFSRTFLTFLTLDTNSNHPNNPTFVPLQFFNESSRTPSTTNNDFEMLTSTFVEFICYGQFALSTDIDANLTQAFQGTRKGTFIAGPAEKFAFGGTGDEVGAVTLLGLVHTIEGTAANNYMERSYIYSLSNDSVFVETEFELLPAGD